MANYLAYVVFIAALVLGSHVLGDTNMVGTDALAAGDKSMQRRSALETFLGPRVPDDECTCCPYCLKPETIAFCVCCPDCKWDY